MCGSPLRLCKSMMHRFQRHMCESVTTHNCCEEANMRQRRMILCIVCEVNGDKNYD